MPKRAALKLDAMTVPELLQLRDKIRTTLSDRIEAERQELQRKIDELSKLEGSGSGDVASAPRVTQAKRRIGRRRGGNDKTHPLKGRTVAPKYRDPENPGQTWAGRGQAQRWLSAYESPAQKSEEF